MSAPVLETRKLSVLLDGAPILQDIDLELRPGEVLGILGSNGAGKTTLLKALAGLVPSSGDIFLMERPASRIAPKERARMAAWLAQQADFAWPVSVRTAVALGRIPHLSSLSSPGREDLEATERALADARIGHLAEKRLDRLSGGERSRVMLARALAVEAPILLVDEPAAFLDPAQQLSTLSLLRSRAESGCAVIAVMHDLALAARFCHRILLLRQGRAEALGPPCEVLTDQSLARIYGVRAIRGEWRDQPWLIPWETL